VTLVHDSKAAAEKDVFLKNHRDEILTLYRLKDPSPEEMERYNELCDSLSRFSDNVWKVE
jgi:hypothetical protein